MQRSRKRPLSNRDDPTSKLRHWMSDHLARCMQEGAAYAHSDIANGRLATTPSMQPLRLTAAWRPIGEVHDA